MNAETAPSGPVRVLILTSSTGSGHDMRAKALKHWMEQLYPPGALQVHIEHLIERASWLGRFGVWVYNTIQRFAPFLHHLYWHIVEVFSALHQTKVTYGGRYYRDLVRHGRPDLIVSVHDSLNRGYFEDARRVLAPKVPRCVTYSGEWSGGYGFSRNWVNPSADLFVSRTEDALDKVVQLGMDRSRCRVFTNLLPPRDFEERMTPQALRTFRSETLGLEPDRFTLLLATGAFGANHHLRFLSRLASLGERVQAIVVCGRNKEIYQRVHEWHAKHPGLRMHIEGFSTRMHQFLQCSDAVVTRGGSNTAAEALFFECPILFNRFGGLMPQELLTVRYFTDHNAGVVIRNLDHFAAIVGDWANRSDAYEEVLKALRALRMEDHPKELLSMLLADLPVPSLS